MTKKVTRMRVRKYVDEEFGAGTYDELLAGEKVLTINGETYSVEELKDTNVFVRSNAEVFVEEKVDPAPPKSEAVMTLEDKIGVEKLADVMAGRAVLALNGEQVCVRSLTDAALYSKLSKADRALVIKAAQGG